MAIEVNKKEYLNVWQQNEYPWAIKNKRQLQGASPAFTGKMNGISLETRYHVFKWYLISSLTH